MCQINAGKGGIFIVFMPCILINSLFRHLVKILINSFAVDLLSWTFFCWLWFHFMNLIGCIWVLE